MPNRERYGLKTIKAIKTALKQGGHQVKTFEGDKNIIANLEDFMPAVIAGERPGLVFNLSYGIQGKARYTHIPGILEMIGVPYLGSSPDTHALALDKVVTKMILRQRGLPTPNFDVLDAGTDRLVARAPLFAPGFIVLLVLPLILVVAVVVLERRRLRPKDLPRGSPLSRAATALADAGGAEGAAEAFASYFRERLDLGEGEITPRSEQSAQQ